MGNWSVVHGSSLSLRSLSESPNNFDNDYHYYYYYINFPKTSSLTLKLEFLLDKQANIETHMLLLFK